MAPDPARPKNTYVREDKIVPHLAERRPVTDRPDPGAAHRGARRRLGLAGHANTNAELVPAARAEIARLSGGAPQS